MCWHLPFPASLRLSYWIAKAKMRNYLVQSHVFFGISQKRVGLLVHPTAFYRLDNATIFWKITPIILNIKSSWGISTVHCINSTISHSFPSALWNSNTLCLIYHSSKHSPTRKDFFSIDRRLKSSWSLRRFKLKIQKISSWKDCSSYRKSWPSSARRKRPPKFAALRASLSYKTTKRPRSFGRTAYSRKE